MIRLTAAAQRHISELENFYTELGRDQAIVRMTSCLQTALAQIDQQTAIAFPAPRPYPELAARGWQWTKAERYWIGFKRLGADVAITAVFYDTADIPGRLQA